MEYLAKPTYTWTNDEGLFKLMRQDVATVVKQLERKKRRSILLKAFLFPFLYLIVYAGALLWGNRLAIFYSCYFALGLLLVFIFLNIIHDAVHNTIFQGKKMNELYVYLFDLMGANSFIWKQRHIRFHHNYPNVNGWDTDIEQSTVARVFPTGNFSKFHRYQHIYLPFLYPFYLMNWLLIRDFKDFFSGEKTVRKLVHIPFIEYVKLFLFKILFLYYLIVLPVLVLSITWLTSITGFLLMLFTASIVSLFVLLSPHANTESEFPLPDKSNKLPYSWMMHMLKTTNDVSNDNWFTRFFMGCFNYHVVHHLFPNINHAFYPEMTVILKKYAQLYDLPYRQFSLFASLKNHFRLLKQNRVPENIFEETM